MSFLKEKIKHFLQTHWIGIVISITIGAIVAAPPIVWHFSAAYRGMEMLKTNTETHYVAQIQELYDEHYGLGDPYLPDNKDALYLFPPLAPYLMFGLGKLFGLSAIQATMVFRFIFVSLLSFFIYLFATDLAEDRRIGYVAAPFVVLAYGLVDPANIAAIVTGHFTLDTGFLDYGRPVTPQISSLFFFSYLFCLWRSFQRTGKEKLYYGIAAMFILGASFFVYLFTWTFCFALNGSLFLVAAIRKEWGKVRTILWISLGGLLLGIPYLFHTWIVSRNPLYTEVAPRFGFVHTHAPNISRLMIGVALIVAATWRWITKELQDFFLAFLVTAFVVVNEQLVTGLFIFNHHYHWYYNTPLAIVVLLVILFAGPKKFSVRTSLIVGICAASTVLLLVYGGIVEVSSYRAAILQMQEDNRYAVAFAWLNANTPKDTTIFAPLSIADRIPAMTRDNVYYSGSALYALVSNERLLESYLVYTYLAGVPKENIRNYLEAHREDISNFAFGYTYYFQPGVCVGCFPASVIDRMTATYQSFSDARVVQLLQTRQVSYLLWDKKNNPDWIIPRLHLALTKTFGEIGLYRVNLSSSQ